VVRISDDRATPGRVLRVAFLLWFLVLCSPPPAAAQAGAKTDILTGRVLDAAGAPLQGAVVAATALETGMRRATLSNAQGRYTLIFPDGGGRYELQVSRIGMRTERSLLTVLPSQDVLVTEVRLEVAPVALEEVMVVAEVARLELDSGEPGLHGDLLTLLPIDPASLAAVAALDASVLGLETTDSIGSGGFSVLGQRPDLNHVSVDGASFGSPRGGAEGELGIPPEAVRLTRVITNSYDISRGRFSGGQISATTRGGSNRAEGSLTYSLFEPRLQWERGGSTASPPFTQHRVSAGYGGPVVRDRVFYFLSGALRHRAQDVASLVQADASALEQLGTHPDSVARFLTILREQGLSPSEPVPITGQLVEELSLFARLDFVLSERHSLMARADGRANYREGGRVSSLGLPHSGGSDAGGGGGAMVSLTSRFGERLINEFRGYVSRHESDAEPYFPVPEGRVRVVSYLPDGTRSVSNLVFGGNRSLPVTSRERGLEASNELSVLLGDRHRLRLGALLHATRSAQEFSPIQHGTYSFNSLESFAANVPTSFSRSLRAGTREGGGANLALYLGDIWQYSRELQLTYGVRAESSVFGRRPDYNPLIDSLFGRRTDHFPAELALTPRVGFTYAVASPERGAPALLTVRGGVGAFRGQPPFSLYSTALDATGLPGGQVQIACVGQAVPIPDWTRFRSDPAQIPDACADGEASGSPSGRAPNATVFTPGFRAPRSWRGSLEVERRLGPALTVSLSGTHNLGANLYGVSDLNLDASPRFTLPAEAGRPVFVGPAAIVEGTGSVGMMDSRIHPELGQVLELHSGLRSRSTQWALAMRGRFPSGLALQSSYTLSSARDQSSFSCCSALQAIGSPTTAGNPNEAEWSRSDFERRHSVALTLGVPVRPWMELTLVGRSNTGAPYTPLVGGDINGDGVRSNDRAFIFDPALTADSATAAGMARLLAGSPARIRNCLARQRGEVAGRNSCLGPRQSSLELRANLQPQLPWGLGRRVGGSVASQNLLTGLDQLLSGSGALRGWGQRLAPDPTLLYPRGFDPATRSFRYEVNERFGNARLGRLPLGAPFQLHLEARVALGAEPRRRR
jgi:hypothetical protein